MSIQIIKTLPDWEEQQITWEEIYATNPNHTPFQSFEWQHTWWKHLGDGDLFIIRVDNSEGKCVGFAPFYLRKYYYGFPLKHLAFIGVKRTDYLDFIISKDQEEFFFEELFTHLKNLSKKFQFIELKDLPDTSINLPFLTKIIGKHFPIYAMESSRICVTLPLESEWEAFLDRLGKRIRKDVNYDRRYISKRHETELVEYRNGQNVKKGYKDLVQIYNQRWQDEKGETRYQVKDMAQFEAEVCDRLSQKGDFRLWIYYADGEPVSGVSGYERNNKIYADTYAHLPSWHKLSVGNIVLGHALEKCIELGLNEFDLSRGQEPYKYHWKGQEKRNFHIKIFRNHWAMAFAGLIEQLYLTAATNDKLQKIYSKYRKIRFGE